MLYRKDKAKNFQNDLINRGYSKLLLSDFEDDHPITIEHYVLLKTGEPEPVGYGIINLKSKAALRILRQYLTQIQIHPRF